MSETYAGDVREQTTTAGSVIIGVISAVSALLVIAALVYAAGTGSRHQAALAAAGCEPNLSPSGLPCTTVQMLTSRYAGIVTPATQELNTDVAAYNASQAGRRVVAEAALTAEVTVENTLGASLARFPFPPAVAAMGKVAIRDSQAAAALTAEQARSASLVQMRSLDGRVAAARAAVQAEMALLAKALAAPPAASQEP
jgi:hypothetical protein